MIPATLPRPDFNIHWDIPKVFVVHCARLAPHKDWGGNEPERLARALSVLEPIAQRAEASLAEVIVLRGNVGGKRATADASVPFTAPFAPGRSDATDEITEAASFDEIEPIHDRLRNCAKKD